MTGNLVKKGSVTVYTLVFGTIFLFVFMSLMNMVLTWHRVSLQSAAQQSSLHIAEAGIEYYKWYFLHFPEDLLDGPMTYGPLPFQDPQGRVVGEFLIEVESTLQCGEIGAVDISSTGWTSQFPEVSRTVQIRYARPSVADFASIINSNVWIGPDHEIKGPYHSNGGIRMDGENQSLVTSARSSWICTGSFGCEPSEERPGVFTTANGKEELFSFPVVPFDFDGMTGDIAAIRSATIPSPEGQGRGVYIPSSVSGNGYRVLLSGRGMSVYEVTALDQVYAYSQERGWHWERSIIADEQFYGSYDLPDECGAVFIEDDIWLEGSVEGKVTLTAGNMTDPNVSSNVWLKNNIEYSGPAGGRDGSNGLLVIAQGDVSITLDSPDSMEIQGAFIAQNGRFGRNHYPCSLYPDDCLKSYIEVVGSVVSNGRVGTQWVDSIGTILSGYVRRETIYDPRQSPDPAPFLPSTSPLFKVVRWKEVR